MDQLKPLLAAAFTILGIAIGAGLNHYFSAQRDVSSDLFSARLNAYVAFLDGQAMLARANSDKAAEEAANKQITKAKFSLAMLASEDVLEAMVDFWMADPSKTYPPCSDPALRIKDTEIYAEIREEMIRGEDAEIDMATLVPFIWGCTLSRN